MNINSNRLKERGIISFWKARIDSVVRNRFLIKELLYLSLTEQYKKSLLGKFWVLIYPFLSISAWLVLNYAGMYEPGATKIPYVAYLLLSMSIWLFFTSFFKHLATSVTESGKMLMEAPFEMEAKIVEKILLSIINLLIPLSISLLVLLVMGVEFSWSIIFAIPTLIPLMLMGISIGVFFSLIEVIFNDIYLAVNQGMNVLMFLTPVVYTEKVDSPLIQQIITYNPLTYLISVPRNFLVGEPIEDWTGFIYSSLLAFFIFIIVIHFFFNSVYKIVEKILD